MEIRLVHRQSHHHPSFSRYKANFILQLSERILDKARMCSIRHEMQDSKLSDHWPVTLDLAFDP